MNPFDRLKKINHGRYDAWYIDDEVILYFDNPKHDLDRKQLFEDWVTECKKVLILKEVET